MIKITEEVISKVITLEEIMGDKKDDKKDDIVETTIERKTSYEYQELDDNIKRARAEYISTDKSLKTISKEYSIEEKKLRKLCGAGKWNIIKRNPEAREFLLDVVNEVYGAIDIYEFAKYLSLSCMKQSEYQNPKDLTVLVNLFKLCNDEINKLRMANMNKENLLSDVSSGGV